MLLLVTEVSSPVHVTKIERTLSEPTGQSNTVSQALYSTTPSGS